jgi:hypothetical protein
MATQIGKAHIYGLSGATIKNAATWGVLYPNMQSVRLSHNAKVDEIKGQGGEVGSIIASGETLECTFELIPEGSDTISTIADAKTVCGIPPTLAAMTIAGLPVVAMGCWSDALNTAGTPSGSLWIYMGGASVNGVNDDKWTVSFPCKRFPEITSATPLT